MLKRRIGTLFLITCLIFASIPAVLGAQNAVTVSPTSGGDAQIAINNAINSVASGATSDNPGHVLLTAGTYTISGPIRLKSNVVLEGAGDSTIIFADGSVCNSAEEPGYVYGSGISNIGISNLQFKSSASKISDGGHGDYRNCIKLSSVSNGAVHDILFTPYHYGDSVRISKSTNINVYNCTIGSGHDGISFLSGSSNCRAYNNDIEIRVNTGIRVDNGKSIRLDHNIFHGSYGSGWCCTEMENQVDVEIDHNIFHDYRGSSGSAAVQPVHAEGSVSVHDNVLWNVGGISMGSGSGNIINPSDQNVDNWVEKGYGYGSISAAPAKTTDSKDATALQSPTADFVSGVTSGKAPLEVQFSSKTMGNPTDYYWTFIRSDGYKGNDWSSHHAVTAKHTFTEPGTYTISLTVANAAGNNTATKENYITVE